MRRTKEILIQGLKFVWYEGNFLAFEYIPIDFAVPNLNLN